MTRRSLASLALAAVVVVPARAPAAGLAISSKKTLYCELETPQGSSSCLFPVTATRWPSWVPDSSKSGILQLEDFTSQLSGIVSGVSSIQSAISTAMNIAGVLGLYTPGPSEQDLIYRDVEQILQIVQELRVLQQLTYDGLYQQNNQQYLDESRGLAQTAIDRYGDYYTLHPDYSGCLLSGTASCPFWATDPPSATAAVDAQHDMDDALNRLDLQNPLDPVWMDNGVQPAFDPRLAATAYIGMVAQELHILSWEVGAQRLPTSQGFHDRLLRRARFINQVLIPQAKQWVTSRCKDGPNVKDPTGAPSPLGTRFTPGTYFSSYLRWRNGYPYYEYYYDGTWTKNCDYSAADVQVYWCTADAGFTCSSPMPSSPDAANPFRAGDDTEQATLERMGLSNWAYLGANLVGLANGATYEGCYAYDYSATQLLPHARTVPSQTVADCISAARANHENFAQLTTWGCFTGPDLAPLTRVRDARCDIECATSHDNIVTSSGEMCGGGNATSVYRVAASASEMVASNIVGGKTSYLGCYRPLTLVAREMSVTSADACLAAAVSAGVVYASLEPGGVCRLANNLFGAAALPEASCSTPCVGSPDQVCGGAGAATVFVTNDPLPLRCAGATADCNGNLADGCETNLSSSASCGACFHACGPTEYCGSGQTCQSTTLMNVAWGLSQGLSFTGTSSTTGAQGAYTPVTGASGTFVAPGSGDVTLKIDLMAYVPAGPSNMSLDLQFVVDGRVAATGRFSTSIISFSTTLPAVAYGTHTVSVQARSVLNGGPPVKVQLYGNTGGAAQGCYGYTACGPTPANLVATLIPR